MFSYSIARIEKHLYNITRLKRKTGVNLQKELNRLF